MSRRTSKNAQFSKALEESLNLMEKQISQLKANTTIPKNLETGFEPIAPLPQVFLYAPVYLNNVERKWRQR